MTRTVIDYYLIVRVGLIGCFVENKEQENPTSAVGLSRTGLIYGNRTH